MKLLKPKWVSHAGTPIFSVDVHPDGSRFATGGQKEESGVVVIWNMAPVQSAEAEKETKIPRVLCEMTNHLACVNSVRWSRDGKWLASGGDDALILIWEYRHKAGATPAFGSANPIIEHWGCGFTLRGHNGDVLDLSWSHDQRFLASASVDNSLIIWNARKFPEKISVISSHVGLVKGVAWDPVGKYIASQSDDKTVRVWRTSDWKEEAQISKPFRNCGGTTHVLRLSWSPDGRFIVSAHSLNNDGPTAHIIDRTNWKTGMDFVGHRKAIEVVQFNSQLFSHNGEDNHGCVAMGSRDRSLSVWLTSLKRPLVVIHDLFKNSVVDLSWSEDGYSLLASSLDGTLAYLSFSEEDLGRSLDKQAIDELFVELYGSRRPGNKRLSSPSEHLLIEDPAMLKLHKNLVDPFESEEKPSSTAAVPLVEPNIPIRQGTEETGTGSGTGTGTSSSPVVQKQIESRTKDGRRRITPVTLSTIATSSPSNASFGTPLSLKSQSLQSASPDTSVGFKTATPRKDIMDTSVKSPPAKPISFSSLSSANDKNDEKETVTKTKKDEAKTKSSVSSISAAKALIAGRKRPNEEEVSSQKPKRTKRSKASENTDHTPQVKPTTPQKVTPDGRSISCRLCPPEVEPTLAVQFPSVDCGRGPKAVKVSNNCGRGEATVLCVSEEESSHWSITLASCVLVMAANHSVTCLACQDGSALLMSTSTGRLIFPQFHLTSLPYSVKIISHFIVIATIEATISVFDTTSMRTLLSNTSFAHLINSATLKDISLTRKGTPTITTNRGVYCYHDDMSVWFELSNAQEKLETMRSIQVPSVLMDATPLQSLQQSFKASTDASITGRGSQQATLRYLESQVLRSQALESALEHNHWIKSYVRYMVHETLEDRLREFCMELIRSSRGCVPTLGGQGGAVVQELLAIIARNAKLQRLYTELSDAAESRRTC